MAIVEEPVIIFETWKGADTVEEAVLMKPLSNNPSPPRVNVEDAERLFEM